MFAFVVIAEVLLARYGYRASDTLALLWTASLFALMFGAGAALLIRKPWRPNGQGK